MARIARIIGWLAVLGIGVLSLVPGDMRPHTGASGKFEHAAAYFVTAAILAFGYESRRHAMAVALLLCFYAAVLEMAQLLVPGRIAALAGFAASVSGVFIGSALGWIVLRAIRRDST